MKDNLRYGFQSYLSPEFPSQVIIDVTEFCNLACIHCPQTDFSKSELFQGRNLNLSFHKKVIDEIARDGKDYCKYLRYTGQGEPLLHPHFIEMIEYAAKHAKVPINVTTNGMLLTEKRAKALLQAGVNVFDISIDAHTPETYAVIRRRGNLNITRPNVLRLIDLIKTGGYKTKVVVSFVEQTLNIHESKDFEKFWRDAGAEYIVIRRLHSSGGVKKEFVQVNTKRYPCLYPWERLTLSPNGFIHYCPQDWVNGSVICNIEKTTIRDVWQGDVMKDLRNAHLKNSFSNHSFCGQCPDWSTTRWPDEDRSYSNMMQEISISDTEK